MSLVFTHNEGDALGDAIRALPEALSIKSYDCWEARPDNRVGVDLFAVAETFPVFGGEEFLFDVDTGHTHPPQIDALWPSAPDYVEYLSYEYEDIRDADVDAPIGVTLTIGIHEDPQSDTRNLTAVGLSEIVGRLRGTLCLNRDGTGVGLEQWSDSVTEQGSEHDDTADDPEHTAIDVLDPSDDIEDPDPVFTVEFACGNCGRTFTYMFPTEVRVGTGDEISPMYSTPGTNRAGYSSGFNDYDIIECPTCERRGSITIEDRQPIDTDDDE
jgi:hypothetical protein